MWIVRENLAILAIILCIISLCVTAEIRTFSHNEGKDYGQTALPRVWKSEAYDDGTIVARIVRQNMSASTAIKTCFNEMLSLRIIHPNGTVDEKDIKLNIQPLNYCIFQNGTELLNYYLIRKNHILITYYNMIDIYSYEEWGMVVDFDGREYDREFFGTTSANEITQFMPNSKIQLNINREKGLLRLETHNDLNYVEWKQWRIDLGGLFNGLTFGKMYLLPSSFISTIISTVDEAYAIAFVNTTNNFIATDPPQSQLYILPIGYNESTFFPPLLIYQAPNLNFLAFSCGIAFVYSDKAGQACILTMSQKDPAGLTLDNIFYAKVNFFSFGSVTSTTTIDHIVPNISNNDLNIVWEVNSLLIGGYMLTNTIKDSQNNHFIYGYLFSGKKADYIPWEFSEPVLTNLNGVYQVLPHNNTLLVAQKETSNSWQFQVIDLPKFASDEDKGYFNPNIITTIPAIDSSIDDPTAGSHQVSIK